MVRVTSLLNSGADVEIRDHEVCYSPTMVVCSSDYGFIVLSSVVMSYPRNYCITVYGHRMVGGALGQGTCTSTLQ